MHHTTHSLSTWCLLAVDQVIVITVSSLFFGGVSAVVLNSLHDRFGEALALNVNTILEVVLVVVSIVGNIVLFVPAWWKQRRTAKLWERGVTSSAVPGASAYIVPRSFAAVSGLMEKAQYFTVAQMTGKS